MTFESRRGLAVIGAVAVGLTASSIVPIHVMEDDAGGLVALAAATLLFGEGVVVLLRGALRSRGRPYGIRLRATAPSVAVYVSSAASVVFVYWVIARAFLKSDVELGDSTLSTDFPLTAVAGPMAVFAAVVCVMWFAILGITQILRTRASEAPTTTS